MQQCSKKENLKAIIGDDSMNRIPLFRHGSQGKPDYKFDAEYRAVTNYIQRRDTEVLIYQDRILTIYQLAHLIVFELPKIIEQGISILSEPQRRTQQG